LRAHSFFTVFFAVFLILCLFTCRSLHCEETSPGDERLNREFVRNLGADLKNVCLSPAGWKGKDLLTLTAVLGAGLAVAMFDEDIQERVLERRNKTSQKLSDIASQGGNGLALSGLIAGLYVTGEIAGERGLRRTALLSAESFIIASLLTSVLKFAVGRARPKSGEGSDSYHPFAAKSGYASFPSGHSSGAWSVASVIADQTDSLIIDVTAYGLATLAAFSRVHDDKHWTSDVLLGSALGYAVGKKVCALNGRREDRKLGFSLDVSRNRRAIMLSYSF